MRAMAMQILTNEDRARVRPLLPPPSQAGHLAMAHAVIDGTMPGHVLADPAGPGATPRWALVLNDCGFHTAFGTPPDAPAVQALVAQAAAIVSSEPGLVVDVSGRWAEALHPLLPGGYFRDEYHAPAALPPSRPLPPGFRLMPLDAEIARRFEGAVDPWVVRIWGGPEAFARASFGHAVLGPGGELASFCAALAVGGGEAEVEIGTAERFQGRGLAHAAGCAFMASAMARGLVPAWTTRADNAPSHRLATSLGYARFRRVACLPLDRAPRD